MIKAKAERAPKDGWDKVGIIFTGLAGIVTPVVIGLSVWVWNHERTTRDAAVQMVGIALGVLSEEPKALQGDDPLREWAINVLMNPTEPPVLSEAAAADLRKRSIRSEAWAFDVAAAMKAPILIEKPLTLPEEGGSLENLGP